MGMPVLPADFQQAIVTPTGSVCDRLKALFSLAEKLYTAWNWLFDSAGEATANFKSLFASIGVPVGGVIWWPVSSIPNGYLVANGQEVSKTQYAALYAVYGNTQGTATNSSNFKLPNLQGKTLAGANGTSFLLGQSIGAETVALTEDELPVHRFFIAKNNSVSSLGALNSGNYLERILTSGANIDYSLIGGTAEPDIGLTSSVGGDAAHANIQPTVVGYWLVKT